MAVFLTGDIHGANGAKRLGSRRFDAAGLGRDDFVIILGDFGLVWHDPPSAEERYWLDWFEAKPWTTLFIDGNHENHDLLAAMPVSQWHGGDVHFIREHVIHLMRGHVFDIGGHTFFTIGGARSVDKDWRTPGLDWWAQEVPDAEERARAEAKVAEVGKVDYVLTHCPPTREMDSLTRKLGIGKTPDAYADWLDREVSMKLGYERWFYGHMHVDMPARKPFTPLYEVIYDLDCTGRTSFGPNADGSGLQGGDWSMKKPRYGMTQWWIGEREGGISVHGTVYGRRECEGRTLHSSWIVGASLEGETVVVETVNSVYACPLSECRDAGTLKELVGIEGSGLSAHAAERAAGLVGTLREERKAAEAAQIEPLVPGRHRKFVFIEFDTRAGTCFSRMLVKAEEGDVMLERGEVYVHVGMFQDSVLLPWPDIPCAEFRYFPDYRHVRFYQFAGDRGPVYVANCAESDGPIRVETPEGCYLLPPGAICETNREKPCEYRYKERG